MTDILVAPEPVPDAVPAVANGEANGEANPAAGAPPAGPGAQNPVAARNAYYPAPSPQYAPGGHTSCPPYYNAGYNRGYGATTTAPAGFYGGPAAARPHPQAGPAPGYPFVHSGYGPVPYGSPQLPFLHPYQHQQYQATQQALARVRTVEKLRHKYWGGGPNARAWGGTEAAVSGGEPRQWGGTTEKTSPAEQALYTQEQLEWMADQNPYGYLQLEAEEEEAEMVVR